MRKFECPTHTHQRQLRFRRGIQIQTHSPNQVLSKVNFTIQQQGIFSVSGSTIAMGSLDPYVRWLCPMTALVEVPELFSIIFLIILILFWKITPNFMALTNRKIFSRTPPPFLKDRPQTNTILNSSISANFEPPKFRKNGDSNLRTLYAAPSKSAQVRSVSKNLGWAARAEPNNLSCLACTRCSFWFCSNWLKSLINGSINEMAKFRKRCNFIHLGANDTALQVQIFQKIIIFPGSFFGMIGRYAGLAVFSNKYAVELHISTKNVWVASKFCIRGWGR